MPKFEYLVKDPSGKDIQGVQEADEASKLVETFHQKGYTIVKINEVKETSQFFSMSLSGTTKTRGLKRKIKLEEMVVFSRQLATMINAGVPLVQSLDILSQQMDNPAFRKVSLDLKFAVEGGKSFSESLEEHKKVFTPLFINMVRAGESSGKLDEILDRIATYLEKTNILIKKVKAALVYPAVVSSVAMLITYGLFTFVIPKFAEIFTQLDAELPLPTQIAINISYLIRDNSLLLIGGVIAFILLFKIIIKTPQGRLWFDRSKLSLPIFGKLLLKVAVSKFSRTLSTLVKSGVPILASLEIVAKTSGNKLIETIIDGLRNSVKEGGGIAEPLIKSKHFPPMVSRMIAIGEETGQMELMLSKIADFYDQEVDTAVSALTSLIEPLIIVFLGGIIGGIVVSLFLPILTLTQAVM